MPNWCITKIVFKSNNESAIKTFHENVLKQFDHGPNHIQSDFGYGYLGNYALLFGLLKTEEDVLSSKIRMRGSVVDVYDHVVECCDESFVFSILQETANSPMVLLWQEIINTIGYQEDIKIYYQSEEPGWELFWTNDPDGTCFPFRYILEYDVRPRCQFPNVNPNPIMNNTIYNHEFFTCEEDVKRHIIDYITGEIPWCNSIQDYIDYFKQVIKEHPKSNLSPFTKVNYMTGEDIEQISYDEEGIYYYQYENVEIENAN